MPSFRYEATDALGKIVRGTIDADTERGARNQLRGRGLLPLSTAPAARAEGLGASLRARLSDADLAWITRQLASLLAASLPLDAALSATLDQAEKNTSPPAWAACATTCAPATGCRWRWPRGRAISPRSTAR